MKKMILLLLMSLFISGCSFLRVHKIDIEQGNLLSTQEIHQLRLGMAQEEVKDKLGTPMLINIFSPQRIHYVYTLRRGNEPRLTKRIVCVFKNGYLADIKES